MRARRRGAVPMLYGLGVSHAPIIDLGGLPFH
jgi:hypothetical protein